MTQEKKRNLFQKLNTIMGLVGSVPKTGYNSAQGYKFVTESDVMDKVREAALAEGVMLIPSLVESRIESGTTSKGNPFYLNTVTIEIEAIDIDDPSQRYKWNMIGQGTDSQDKGSNKAITGAVKYGLLKTFLIGTGDDAEHDKNDHDYSPAQAKSTRPAPSRPMAPVASKGDDAPPPMSDSEVASVAFSLDDDTPDWMQDSPAQAKNAGNRVYHYSLPMNVKTSNGVLLKDHAKQVHHCKWNPDSKTWSSMKQIPEFDAYIK